MPACRKSSTEKVEAPGAKGRRPLDHPGHQVDRQAAHDDRDQSVAHLQVCQEPDIEREQCHHEEGAARVQDNGYYHAQAGHRDEVGRQRVEDEKPSNNREAEHEGNQRQEHDVGQSGGLVEAMEQAEKDGALEPADKEDAQPDFPSGTGLSHAQCAEHEGGLRRHNVALVDHPLAFAHRDGHRRDFLHGRLAPCKSLSLIYDLVRANKPGRCLIDGGRPIGRHRQSVDYRA